MPTWLTSYHQLHCNLARRLAFPPSRLLLHTHMQRVQLGQLSSVERVHNKEVRHCLLLIVDHELVVIELPAWLGVH